MDTATLLPNGTALVAGGFNVFGDNFFIQRGNLPGSGGPEPPTIARNDIFPWTMQGVEWQYRLSLPSMRCRYLIVNEWSSAPRHVGTTEEPSDRAGEPISLFVLIK
jgi:hypothetical protein